MKTEDQERIEKLVKDGLRKYARDQFSVGITESIVKQIDSLLNETKPE